MTRKLLLILFSAIILSGCSFLSPIKTGPDTKYLINETCEPNTKTPHRKITLLVLPMQSDCLFATKQMAYSICPYRIDYYLRNHWACMPAQMLQNVLVNTLRCTDYFYAVDSSLSNAHYDYVLNSRLLELRQIISCRCAIVKLAIYVQIVNTATNRIVAARQFIVIQGVPQVSPCGEAVAANKAAAYIAKMIANFSLRHIK